MVALHKPLYKIPFYRGGASRGRAGFLMGGVGYEALLAVLPGALT